MATGAVGDVGGREGGGGASGRDISTHESEVGGVARPFKVVSVATKVAEGEGGDVDDAHISQALISEQNLKRVTII
jgi:hypothetical protein